MARVQRFLSEWGLWAAGGLVAFTVLVLAVMWPKHPPVPPLPVMIVLAAAAAGIAFTPAPTWLWRVGRIIAGSVLGFTGVLASFGMAAYLADQKDETVQWFNGYLAFVALLAAAALWVTESRLAARADRETARRDQETVDRHAELLAATRRNTRAWRTSTTALSVVVAAAAATRAVRRRR